MAANESLDDYIFRCTNTSYFNCSLDDYLSIHMGAKSLPLQEAIPITIVLILSFVTGIIGNVCVCIVIIRHPSMRTATNYYLFSLAVSDLLLLLFGLPNDLVLYWNQYPYGFGLLFCKARALISEGASYVSVLTIVAFSLERYLAICHPLHLYAMVGLKRAIKIIAVLWIVAIFAATPVAVYTDIHYKDYPLGSGTNAPESAFCAMLHQPWHIWELSSILFFIIPVLIMLFLYVRMGLQIRNVVGNRRSKFRGSVSCLNDCNSSIHGGNDAKKAQSRKAIIRMLAAVVFAFFICWAPFHIQRLFYLYGAKSEHYQLVNEYLFITAGFLYYLSPSINPILYSIMSRRYRVAFKETLLCKSNRKRYLLHSSFRDTIANQYTEATNITRVRSERRQKYQNSERNHFLNRKETVAFKNDFDHSKISIEIYMPNKTRPYVKYNTPDNFMDSINNIKSDSLVTVVKENERDLNVILDSTSHDSISNLAKDINQ